MPVNISASQTLTLITDADGDGQFDPGDTFGFSITITNSGDTDATGLQFDVPLNGATFVNGSINVSPIVLDDTYAAVGNATFNANAATGVLANDVEFFSDTHTVNSYTAATSQGGSVTVSADGSFTYNPPVGFTGNDSFTYSTIDSQGLTSSNATVTLQVGPSVWFIDNTAAPGGNGTQASPFNSLAAFNAANDGGAGHPKAGDVIYLKFGTGTYTEADGINLLNNQTLIGEGQDLVVTPTAGGPPLTIDTGSAGETPTIVVTGASNEGIQLAQNNTIRGLDINVQHVNAVGIEDGGGTVGSLAVSDVSISGRGQSVDIDQGGTLAVTLDSVTSTEAAVSGIELSGVSGTFTATTVDLRTSIGHALDLSNNTASVAINGGSISAGLPSAMAVKVTGGSGNVTVAASVTDTNSGDVIEITGRSGGTVTFSGGVTASGSTNNGIDINSNTGGTINFTGAVSLTTGTNTAVNLSSNTGATINFNTSGAGLDITTTSGTGFLATGGGTVSVTGSGNTITAAGGTALNVSGTTIGANDLNFVSISANGGATGIILNNTGALGGLTVTGSGTTDDSGGIIQNTTSHGIVLSNTQFTTLSNLTIGDATTTPNTSNGPINFTPSIGGSGISMNNADNTTLTNITIAKTEMSGIDGTGVTIGRNKFETGEVGGLNPFGEQGLQVRADGNANINVTVGGNSLFDAVDGNGIFIVSEGTGTVNAIIRDTIVQNSDALGIVLFGGTGDHTNTLNSKFNFDIIGDGAGASSSVKVTGTNSTAISIQPNGNSSMNGTVKGVYVNGSTIGRGIEVASDDASDAVIAIDNNVILNTAFNGIFANNNDNGRLDLHIRNNNVSAPLDTAIPSGLAVHGIEVNPVPPDPGFNNVTTLNISGNTSAGNAASGGAAFRLRERGDGVTFNLEGLGADTNNIATVQAHVTGRGNTGSVSVTVVDVYDGVPNGTTLEPHTPPAPLLAAPFPLPADPDPVVPAPIDPPPAGDPDPDPPPVVDPAPSPVVDDGVLSLAELEFIVQAAIVRWAATGLSGAQAAALDAVTFSIEDLPGFEIGRFEPGHITIDTDAFGAGWFVDATPLDDSEFAAGNPPPRSATWTCSPPSCTRWATSSASAITTTMAAPPTSCTAISISGNAARPARAAPRARFPAPSAARPSSARPSSSARCPPATASPSRSAPRSTRRSTSSFRISASWAASSAAISPPSSPMAGCTARSRPIR